MASVKQFADDGGLVLGICNGFQILCEAGMLPGALTRNASLQFRCQPAWLRVEQNRSRFTAASQVGDILQIPVSHGEGRYVADEETLAELESSGRVLFRYVNPDGTAVGDNTPNGSIHDIAGIANAAGNVVGMMPHPERACELLLGSDDGNAILASIASGAAVGVA